MPAIKARPRIAYLWTATGLLAMRVLCHWPQALVHEGYIYEPDVAADGSVLVRRGGWSGAEIVHYRQRRAIRCDDVPALIEAYGITEEDIHGERSRARAPR